MARGSRYNTNRLVGPDKITQLEYIDIAKASMYTEAVVPVPSGSIDVAAGTKSLGTAVEGSVLRIVPNGATTITQGTIRFNNAATAGAPVGEVIHFNTGSGSFLVVVPPGALGIIIVGTALTAIEIILDD